jgi:cation diffusion facilitator family transporter
MAYAILSNTLVGWRLSSIARTSGSPSLKTEALHLKGDSFMSFGLLAGLLAVRQTGLLWIDPVMAILAAAIGFGVAARQLINLGHSLMDGSLPSEEVAKLRQVLCNHPAARGYHNLRTRAVGSVRFIDLHVMLDDNLSFVQAHAEAEAIEDELRQTLDGAVVTIHFEPFEAETTHRREAHGNDIP